MSDKGTFPRQDTLGFCLLELAAICGEFPASILPRIPGSSSYKEAVITSLKKEGQAAWFPAGAESKRQAPGREPRTVFILPYRGHGYQPDQKRSNEKDAAAPDSGDLCRHAERRSRSFP